MTVTSIYLAERSRLREMVICNHDYKAEMAWLDCIIKRHACSLGECGLQRQPTRETSKDVAKVSRDDKSISKAWAMRDSQELKIWWQNKRHRRGRVSVTSRFAPPLTQGPETLVVYSTYWSLRLFAFFLGYSFLLWGTLLAHDASCVVLAACDFTYLLVCKNATDILIEKSTDILMWDLVANAVFKMDEMCLIAKIL